MKNPFLNLYVSVIMVGACEGASAEHLYVR